MIHQEGAHLRMSAVEPQAIQQTHTVYLSYASCQAPALVTVSGLHVPEKNHKTRERKTARAWNLGKGTEQGRQDLPQERLLLVLNSDETPSP